MPYDRYRFAFRCEMFSDVVLVAVELLEFECHGHHFHFDHGRTVAVEISKLGARRSTTGTKWSINSRSNYQSVHHVRLFLKLIRWWIYLDSMMLSCEHLRSSPYAVERDDADIMQVKTFFLSHLRKTRYSANEGERFHMLGRPRFGVTLVIEAWTTPGSRSSLLFVQHLATILCQCWKWTTRQDWEDSKW